MTHIVKPYELLEFVSGKEGQVTTLNKPSSHSLSSKQFRRGATNKQQPHPLVTSNGKSALGT